MEKRKGGGKSTFIKMREVVPCINFIKCYKLEPDIIKISECFYSILKKRILLCGLWWDLVCEVKILSLNLLGSMEKKCRKCRQNVPFS